MWPASPVVRLDADTETAGAHRAPGRRSPWLVAALLCPCHLPLLATILGTGGLTGLLARNQSVSLLAVALLLEFSLSRPRGSSVPMCGEKRDWMKRTRLVAATAAPAAAVVVFGGIYGSLAEPLMGWRATLLRLRCLQPLSRP